MRIDVTQNDILNGVRSDFCACPIALAAMRATGKKTWVYLGLMSCDWGYLRLPDEASAFVYDFDSGKEVQPFSFEVQDAPDQ